MKTGPGRNSKSALPLVEDRGAGDVGGEEVGGELDPAELEAHRLGEGARDQGLGQAREVLDQHVAAGEDPDQQQVEGIPLADDDLLDLVEDRLSGGGDVRDGGHRRRGGGRAEERGWRDCGHGWDQMISRRSSTLPTSSEEAPGAVISGRRGLRRPSNGSPGIPTRAATSPAPGSTSTRRRAQSSAHASSRSSGRSRASASSATRERRRPAAPAREAAPEPAPARSARDVPARTSRRRPRLPGRPAVEQPPGGARRQAGHVAEEEHRADPLANGASGARNATARVASPASTRGAAARLIAISSCRLEVAAHRRQRIQGGLPHRLVDLLKAEASALKELDQPPGGGPPGAQQDQAPLQVLGGRVRQRRGDPAAPSSRSMAA